MFTKLFVSVLALVVAMLGTSSLARAAEGKTPVEPPKAVPAQEADKKRAKQVEAKTALECYAACKRLAEFDQSASKPSKPGLAGAQKADLRRKAGEYFPSPKRPARVTFIAHIARKRWQ